MTRHLPFCALALVLPSAALAQPGLDDSSPSPIIVTGAGLPLAPGAPAYGSVVIERDRLMDGASGQRDAVGGGGNADGAHPGQDQAGGPARARQ